MLSVSTSADIWEVMNEEISSRPYDRGREIRLTGGSTQYGTADTESALLAAEIDPDHGVTGDAALAFSAKHYDVPIEDIRNTSMRRTAVVAARASIATRLAAAGWSGKRIAHLLHTAACNVLTMLKGGRGFGHQARSRITKTLVARRQRRWPKQVWRTRRPAHTPTSGRREQAVHTLRRLRSCGEEHLFPRLMKRYFAKLDIEEVYTAAFGSAPAPLTLDEAWAAETRGEGVLKFVGGVPLWIPSLPQQTPPVPAGADDQATLVELRPPRAA